MISILQSMKQRKSFECLRLAAKQAIREQRIPFEISRDIPNEETKEAIEEVKMMKQNPSVGQSYTDVDKMMEELLL